MREVDTGDIPPVAGQDMGGVYLKEGGSLESDVVVLQDLPDFLLVDIEARGQTIGSPAHGVFGVLNELDRIGANNQGRKLIL